MIPVKRKPCLVKKDGEKTKALTRAEIISKAIDIFPFYFAQMGLWGVTKSQLKIKAVKNLKYLYHSIYFGGKLDHYRGVVVDLEKSVGAPFVIKQKDLEQMMFCSLMDKLSDAGDDLKLRNREYWKKQRGEGKI